jgi:hypothetical protein
LPIPDGRNIGRNPRARLPANLLSPHQRGLTCSIHSDNLDRLSPWIAELGAQSKVVPLRWTGPISAASAAGRPGRMQRSLHAPPVRRIRSGKCSLCRPRLLVPRVHEASPSALRAQVRIPHWRAILIRAESAHEFWVGFELRRSAAELPGVA